MYVVTANCSYALITAVIKKVNDIVAPRNDNKMQIHSKWIHNPVAPYCITG